MEEKKLKEYIKKLEEQNEALREELSKAECERDAYKSIVDVYNKEAMKKGTEYYPPQMTHDKTTDAITKVTPKEENTETKKMPKGTK